MGGFYEHLDRGFVISAHSIKEIQRRHFRSIVRKPKPIGQTSRSDRQSDSDDVTVRPDSCLITSWLTDKLTGLLAYRRYLDLSVLT